jgi:MoaA/NifB/PqqE/SkfB family radical SAM enzyme
MLPERLNFAIARRCAVACSGCYSFFGRNDPQLEPFARTAAAFAALGLHTLTLSGGDPLTLPDLPAWLAAFRRAGFRCIKLDTVGVGLLAPERAGASGPAELLAAVDHLAIPLDGWSNVSAELFRRGRADLHDRTLDLLAALDAAARGPQLIVNTVVHRGNIAQIERLQPLLAPLRNLAQWNLFQYTPTDQAGPAANAQFGIDDAAFDVARRRFFERFGSAPLPRSNAEVLFRASAERLGHYLLVNSDGMAWLPDAGGLTQNLGVVFGREAQVLQQWEAAVRRLEPAHAAGGHA